MLEFKFQTKFVNGSKNKKDLEPIHSTYKEMAEYQKQGKTIYIKILSGDRKGSIAKFIPARKIKYDYYFNHYNDSWKVESHESGHLIWDNDGRKNKIQYYIAPGFTATESWLKDYNGPTVYKMYNKKSESEKLLKTAKIKDAEGNILNIGDSVIYVNIRYGSGSQISRGTIDRFESQIKRGYRDKLIPLMFTIVKNSKTGEESKIKKSEELIIKLT